MASLTKNDKLYTNYILILSNNILDKNDKFFTERKINFYSKNSNLRYFEEVHD